MQANEHYKMAQVEESHWWYKVLHKQVLTALKKNNISYQSAILDAGAGTGGLLKKMKLAGYNNLHGFDLSPIAIDLCYQKGFSIKQHSLDLIASKHTDCSYDCVISCDVLCYYEENDYLNILHQVHHVLKNHGVLILNLPAYKIFSGIHDKSVGIISRTTSKKIKSELESAGFKLLLLRHWPFVLFPLIFMARCWQKLKMKVQKNHKVLSDINLPSYYINKTFEIITLIEKYVFPNPFFGSSVFIVAVKC